MYQLGIVRPGATIQLPFGSFAGATGAPIAATGLVAADIQVYKDGNTVQRASAAGITVAADFDALTGINTVTIDLSDNTTAGFWSAGSRYVVVVSDITVDSQTVRFPLAAFTIGIPGAVLATTIATLASQTSFTLAAGPAEDNALNGCLLYLHDVASAVQCAFGLVTGYVGSTRTVTLAAAPTFAIAATDNVMVLPPSSVTALTSSALDAIRDRVAKRTTLRGTVGASSTTTSITTSVMSPATSVADQLKGRVVLFDDDTATAALRGQATNITASSASATPTLTVVALTTAPAAGDTFTIV